MSQSLIFHGYDAEAIIKSGLIHSGRCIFTAKDDIEISVYRGTGGIMGIRVNIKRKPDEEISSK